MVSALVSSMAVLLALASSAVPWGVGPAGSGLLFGRSTPGAMADRCRPLYFGIAGASTLWSDDELEVFQRTSGVNPHHLHGF